MENHKNYINSEEFKQDLLTVYETESGRRLLQAMRVEFGIDAPVFKNKEHRRLEDPVHDALLCEGERAVIQWLEKQIKRAYERH